MEKKEFPKKEIPKSAISKPVPKMSGFSARIFGVIKFILGVCLLPFVYSLSVSFLKESRLIDPQLQFCFWSGVVSLLVVYLFIWEPVAIYAKGQKLVEVIFQFFHPLVKFAPYLLPVYTLILFVAYAFAAVTFKSKDLISYFVFLFGFSMMLHLVFSAKSMRSKQGDFLKGNYIFGFSFIYIVNITLLAIGLSFIFKEFSLINFSVWSWDVARGIFEAVFKQLFYQKGGLR